MIFGFNTDVKCGDTVYHVQSEARKLDKLLQTQVFVKGRCLGKYATSYSAHATVADFSEENLHELLKAQHKRFVESARAGTIEEDIEADHDDTHAPAAAAPAPAPAPTPLPDVDLTLSLDDPDLAAIADASAAALTEVEHPHPPNTTSREVAAAVDEAPVAETPPNDPMLDQFMAELDAAEKEPPPPPLPQFVIEATGSVIGKGIGLDCLEPIVAPDGSSVLLNVQVADESGPAQGAQITCRINMPAGPASYIYSQSGAAGIADVRIATNGLDPNTGILIQAAVRGKSASRKFTLRRS